MDIERMGSARENVREQVGGVQEELQILVDVRIQQEGHGAGLRILALGHRELQVSVRIVGFDADHFR